MSGELVESGVTVNPGPAFRAFARLTGSYPAGMRGVDALPEEQSLLFHTLLSDQLAPVRVVLGYHGYVDELGLRKGLIDYLQRQDGIRKGFGALSMPNLIVARSNSLLKMDGNPYIAPMSDGWWHLLVSNPENPLRILIELLWSKLADRFGNIFPVDDNLELERLAPYLDARVAREGDRLGWTYNYVELSKEKLASAEAPNWVPDELEIHEMVVQLQLARKGILDVRDKKFQEYAAEEGFDPYELIGGMVARRMLAWVDEHRVRLIETGVLVTGFTPEGGAFTTSEPELLGSWFGKKLKPR